MYTAVQESGTLKCRVYAQVRGVRLNALVPLFLCFIDLQKAYDFVNRKLLWQVLARSEVPPQIVEK